MTQHIDTASIREFYSKYPDDTVLALCDALDATRAERDQWADNAVYWRKARDLAKLRAVAAEARIAELEADITVIDDLASVALARIAAALAERCEGPMCECCDMVLGALTGGTP